MVTRLYSVGVELCANPIPTPLQRKRTYEGRGCSNSALRDEEGKNLPVISQAGGEENAKVDKLVYVRSLVGIEEQEADG